MTYFENTTLYLISKIEAIIIFFLDGKYDMSADSKLSIKFRTTKRNGLLFYATNSNATHRMTIEEVNGQVGKSKLTVTNFIHNRQASLPWKKCLVWDTMLLDKHLYW